MTTEPPGAAERRLQSDLVAKLASLVDLRMRDIEAKVLNFAGEPPFTPTVSIEPNVGRVDRFAVYEVTYELGAKDKAERAVFRARLVMNLIFDLGDREAVSKADLEAFGAIGVVEIAHPYIREFIHNITFRMGLPPFVLDVAPPIFTKQSES